MTVFALSNRLELVYKYGVVGILSSSSGTLKRKNQKPHWKLSRLQMSIISATSLRTERLLPIFTPQSQPTSFSRFVVHQSPLFLRSRLIFSESRTRVACSKSSEEAEVSTDEWLEKLPDKKKPLYSHSLPCIEAWLRSLGFYQSRDDRALWFVEKPDWNAQLSLDITDLYIRYLKSGPGNLEKDVERRFSYALSREDIENAILGGP